MLPLAWVGSVIEEIGDGLFGADERDDLHVGPDAAQIVQGQHVERVGHGDIEFLGQAGHGDHLVAERHVLGDQVDHVLGNVHLAQRQRRRVEAAGHADHHVLLGHELAFQEQFQQAAALFLLRIEDFAELLLRQQPVGDERVGDAFAK